MAKSPSVSLIERNISSYAVTASNTTVAVVGYATKGPIGTATKVTSFKEFRQKFGYPTTLGFSSLAIQRTFNQGNSLIFYRVAETTGNEAATLSKIVVKNSVDALASYQEFTRTTDVLQGSANYANGIEYSFKIDDGINTEKLIYMRSPSSGRWSINDMLDQMTSQVGATSGYQEFTDKNLLGLSVTSYLFKLAVDGTIVADTGSNNNLMVDVSSSDTIESFAYKLRTAIYGGSRSYDSFLFNVPLDEIVDPAPKTIDSALGLVASRYNFNITNVDGGAATNVVISGLTINTSLRQLAAIINTELTRRSVASVCLPTVKGLYFFHKVNGAESYVEITAGTDQEDFGYGNDLFVALVGSISLPVIGVDSGVDSSDVLVGVDPYTKRIKITSVSTGIDSSIALSISELIGSGKLVSHDLISSTYGLGTEFARNGQGIVNVSVARDIISNKIRISSTGIYTALTDFIKNGSVGLDFLALMPIDAAVTGHPGTSTATTDVIVFSSKETGSSTTRIAVEKTSVVNPLDSTTVNTIKVYYDGELRETFENVSLAIADANYFVNKINETTENGGSEWISVEVFNNGGGNTIDFVDGTYQLGTAADATSVAFAEGMDEADFEAYDYIVGSDGIPTNGGEGLFVDALNSAGDLANKDVFDFHILLTPDNNEEAVQNAAISLAESRKDFVYLVDPPFGLSYEQVRDWHNGIGNFGRNTAVASSYAAVYWPWLKDYDSYSRKYVWVPPSVFIGEKLLEIDSNYYPWVAPAGDTRGKLLANDSEYSPSFAEREELYGDFNCINPIVDFTSKGLIIYGQKTASRENVASNRLNVRRMVIYVKKLIKTALDSMLFEINDTNSWQKATNMVSAILETVRQGGGIAEYAVIIDGTTNTPDIIAQNMMNGIVKIVPTGTIEIIELSINVYKAGSTIE